MCVCVCSWLGCDVWVSSLCVCVAGWGVGCVCVAGWGVMCG